MKRSPVVKAGAKPSRSAALPPKAGARRSATPEKRAEAIAPKRPKAVPARSRVATKASVAVTPPVDRRAASRPTKTARKAAPPATPTTKRAAGRAADRPPAQAAKKSTKKPAVATKAGGKPKPAAPGKASRGGKKRGRARRPPLPVVRVVKVRELDPVAKCGPATSVEQLFRVDESLDGRPTVHLVFFDRHGWYCVHGPRCAAVADVHSHNRTQTRARAGRR